MKVIGELPVIPDRGQEASSTASSQLQADDDDDARFSVTSHEFGVELEEEGESDEEMIPDEVFLEQGPVKFLHKEKRKKLNQAARAVQELASAGRCGTTPTTCTTTSISRSPRARRPGPWRILEIFVCSMTVSLLAAARGWQAGQPVSLPAFDLSRSEDRRQARRYVDHFEPDLFLLKWPSCSTTTSFDYDFGVPTAQVLHAQHQRHEPRWRFAHDVLLAQRARGGLFLCYGPASDASWQHPLLLAAVPGVAQAQTDLCMFGGGRTPQLRQPTRLIGETFLLRSLTRRCPGGLDHPHHRHPFGSERGPRCSRGRWFSDGRRSLPQSWCTKLVECAERALQQRSRMLVQTVSFMAGALLPEEAFVEGDEEALHEMPAARNPEASDESWLDGLEVDRGDFERTEEERTKDGTHNDQVPHNNSNPEGSREVALEVEDDTHNGFVPNNNSNPEGSPEHVDQLRDLLAAGRRDVPDDEVGPKEVDGMSPEPGSKLERLHLVHRRLGHPSNEALVRMLQMGGATEELVEMARTLKCPTCQMRKQPTRPLPARPGSRPIAFNYEVHLDLKYIKDAGGQLYVALSMVDAATCFHAARLLRCREPEHVVSKFMSGWLSIFGIPVAIVLDQGGEFESEFIALLESHGIASKVTGSYAPWQHGFCERQGALLGVAWSAAIEAEKAEGRKAIKLALACALQAKNATISRRGHSSHQLVFGRQAYLPELLDEEVWAAAGLGQALSLEGEVARMAEMRAAAKVALLHGDIHEKLKSALRRAPGGQSRDFAPGEMVFFWSPTSDFKRRRYRKDAGAWRGPAVIFMPDGAQKYFVSWRGRCLLVAAANLKVASLEAAEDQDLRLREAEAHLERGYVDLSADAPSGSEAEAAQAVQGPGVSVLRRRNTLGRKMSEARKMMSNLKSVKKML